MGRSILLLACALAFGCASSGPSPEALAAQHAALEDALATPPAQASPGALVVRLAFGADGDLDLYVTDAGHETVYFGNSPSTTGGELIGDLRCQDPAPRVETIVFDHRRQGSVRVGVDAPERCRENVRAVPFVVELRAGVQRIERRGIAVPGRFEVIVLEVEVEVDGDTPPDHAAP